MRALSGGVCLILFLLGAFPAAAQEPAPGSLDEERALALVTRRVCAELAPAVVEIEALGGLPPRFRAPTSEAEAEQQGVLAKRGFKQAYGPSTGLIVRADGLIATSTFVLAREPRHLIVTLADGRCFVARLRGRDDARALAILQIEAEELPVPRFAPRSALAVGRASISLGRGLASGEPVASLGIISALDRVGGRALQTSADVSPVNYGGPLVSLDGEVQGLLVPLSLRGGMAGVDIYNSGIGFAIPAADLLGLLPKLVDGQRLVAGFLGVVPDMSHRGAGIRVAEVAPGSPAADQLETGDIILALDGAETGEPWQLRRALAKHHAGDAVTLKVQRHTETFEFELKLAEPPPPPEEEHP